MGNFGKSVGEHERESCAGRLILGRLILERFVPDPDETGGSSFDVELVPESVEDEELMEANLGRGVTPGVRPCVGSAFGVDTGGGEAVGVNICAKSGPGSFGVGSGDSDGVKSRSASR